jgi:uncharacterized protein YbjT (DUF2867 family)
MQPDSKPAWIVVTGATAGIGKALVDRLAVEGRNVIAAARDPSRVRIPNGPAAWKPCGLISRTLRR